MSCIALTRTGLLDLAGQGKHLQHLQVSFATAVRVELAAPCCTSLHLKRTMIMLAHDICRART